MGVQGLWELLAPVGRRVSVETLAGKRLAVDASIWMVQFLKAMRDEKGEPVRNAHVLGFFRRICKLLFLRTRPVFVFDGATPPLKRRTLAARRRHRDAARAKLRKTAEKLLISHLKARKLEELAAEIRNSRMQNDAKGRQVESSSGAAGSGDVGSGGFKAGASVDQQSLDELLAASLAAEEEGELLGEEAAPVAGEAFEEEADDEGEEMIFPVSTSNIDPAVLASLPPSMQLDLLVQMRERVMAENRQKYQKIKKAPAKFSELQIQSYLRTVAFRREIDEVQRCAAGKGLEGVQTSRIASDANREFIFSSSFTGDKQVLTRRAEGDGSGNTNTVTKQNTFDFSKSNVLSNLSKSSSEAPAGELTGDLSSDVETYRDERGRVKISRVRALGIRMTRDIQRNLDFIKEYEQENSNRGIYADPGSTSTREVHDLPEDLSEKSEPPRSFADIEDDTETVAGNQQISVAGEVGAHCDELSFNGSKDAIEISFSENQSEVKDKDDQIFLHLASGSSMDLFCGSVQSDKRAEESDDSACMWEEGVVEEIDGALKDNQKEYQSSDARHGEDDRVCDDGVFYVPGVASHSPSESERLSKGVLEEEALIQEAIRRSLQDFEKQKYATVMSGSVNSKGALGTSKPVENTSESCFSLETNFGTTPANIADETTGPENTVKQDAVHNMEPTNSNIQQDLPIAQMVNTDGADFLKATGSPKECFASSNLSATCIGTKPLLTNELNVQQGVETLQIINPTPARLGDSDVSGLTDSVAYGKSDSCLGMTLDKSAEVVSNLDSKTECRVPDNVISDVYGSQASKLENIGVDREKSFVATEPVVDTEIRREKGIEEDTSLSKSTMDDIANNRYMDNLNEVSETNLEKEISVLRQEQRHLGDEWRKLESHADSVSNEMFAECQELLQMFGLPYIIAPTEAEAQCAFMEMKNLVDGVVTDDSDVFLFGSRSVYKNIFDDRKYVETYFMKDIESDLGLNRDKLIRMALLLGSDYTEGVSGIGIVNAIEVVHAFPEEDGLQRFREWIESPDPAILEKLDHTSSNSKKRSLKSSKKKEDATKTNAEASTSEECHHNQPSSIDQDVKEIFMNKHRNVSKNWHIPPSFPSESVTGAYTSPQVDDSSEPFSWGKPDLNLLRKLCWERFGWNNQKADELLLPVLKEYNKHSTQLRLEAFYTFNERFAKIRSQRVKKAIKGITGNSFPDTEDVAHDCSNSMKEGHLCSPTQGEASSMTETRTKTSKPQRRHPTRAKNTNDGATDPPGRSNKNEHSARVRGRGRARKDSGDTAVTGREELHLESTSSHKKDKMNDHTFMPDLVAELRRSTRQRKEVTYAEEDDLDLSLNHIEGNDLQEAAVESKPVENDCDEGKQSYENNGYGFYAKESDVGDDENCPENEGKNGNEDSLEPDPCAKDYLFSGGGFCEEDEGSGDGEPTMEPTACPMTDDFIDPMEEIRGAFVDPQRSNVLSSSDEQLDQHSLLTENAHSTRGGGMKRVLNAMPLLKRKRRKS